MFPNMDITGAYRQLLDISYKELASIIKILGHVVEPQLGDYQARFGQERLTTDQIVMMKELVTTCYAAVIIFVDFKNTYDWIRRNKLLEIKDFQIAPKLAKLTKMNGGTGWKNGNAITFKEIRT